MSELMAHRTVNFGTWGTWQIRQPVAPPQPPRNPTPAPPTLALVAKPRPVYAVGERLVLQHPASVKRFVAEAVVVARYHAIEHGDRRRMRSGSYWLYGVVVDGEDWLLNEAALMVAEVVAKQPVITFPTDASRLAS